MNKKQILLFGGIKHASKVSIWEAEAGWLKIQGQDEQYHELKVNIAYMVRPYLKIATRPETQMKTGKCVVMCSLSSLNYSANTFSGCVCFNNLIDTHIWY